MLSSRTKNILIAAMADKRAASEVQAAIDALHAIAEAAHVASFGSTTNLPASNASLSTSDTYTDAAVKTAIDGAIDAVSAVAETRLDNIESKINAILSSLEAASIMA